MTDPYTLAEPCIDCGSRAGRVPPGRKRPERRGGRCGACHQRHRYQADPAYHRARAAAYRRGEAPPKPPKRPQAPPGAPGSTAAPAVTPAPPPARVAAVAAAWDARLAARRAAREERRQARREASA